MKYFQKIIFIFTLSTLLLGCGISRYETYWEPVQDNGVELSTALNTCSAEAAQAASSASANASSSSTSGGGFAGGFATGLNQSLAGPLARNSAMNSCMMAYGFRKQRMCVSNC